MVVLRTPGSVVARDLILATDVTNIVGCLLGTAGYGQLISLTDKSDATNYANTFGNADTTNGRAVKIQYGTSTTLATFAKAAITLELPATIKHADLANPASGYTSIGARAADGQVVARISGGAQFLLASASDSPSTILTTTGDIIYASSGGVAARLGVGSTHQVLTVAGGVPTWANGSKATLTTAGDLLYGTGSNAISRLAIGTARQVLATNSGATAPEWVASLQSLMTAQGDILQASAANTPARLALGTARQTLAVNSGATALEYVASMQSLLTTQADIIYASSANTPARLAKGTAFQELTINSGATAPQWSSGVLALAAASGDIFYATGANALARLAKGSDGNFLSLASGIPAWVSGGAVTLTTAENLLAGDVALNNTANYFDGPSVSLTAGTWLLTGAVHVQDTAGIANIAAKLWNGTTVKTSAEVTIAAINYGAMLPLSGVVVAAGAETWKISCRDVTSTSGKILATTVLVGTSGANASFLNATKIG